METPKPLLYATILTGTVLIGFLSGIAVGSAKAVNPGLLLTLSIVFVTLIAVTIAFSNLPGHAKTLALVVLGVAAALPLARLSPRIGLAILAVITALVVVYAATETRRILIERYR